MSKPVTTTYSQAGAAIAIEVIVNGVLGSTAPMRPSPRRTTTPTIEGRGDSSGDWAPKVATRTATGAIRAGAYIGLDAEATSNTSAAVATTAPVTRVSCASSIVPSQPAWRAPTTTSASMPRPITESDSAAVTRPRRRRATDSPSEAPVRTTRTVVRPPTPSQLQAKARKVMAATSRHSAPSDSRMRGTEEPADARRLRDRRALRRRAGTGRRPGGESRTPAWSPRPPSTGRFWDRRVSRIRSASCRVRNNEVTASPVSGREQTRHTCGS